LAELLRRLQAAGKVSTDSRIYFVDDGSRDDTWLIIRSLVESGAPVVGIKLSRNRGHQNALLAGLFSARGDAVVSVDADLQDDLNVIEKMLDLFEQGVDVVYGVRRRRDTDTFFKRVTAETFYRAMALLGAQTVFNHADYRLLSRRALTALDGYREVNLFLRGIVPLIGYPSTTVEYDRGLRFAGESKYPLKRMLGLALDAVTSFSVTPLRLISALGFTISAGSMLVSAWALWVALMGNVVPGWASTVLPMYFLGGVQLLSLGVIGEYVGKIYLEAKARPRYFIEQIVNGSARTTSVSRVCGMAQGSDVGVAP
jgi:glycosyltransferase involved in cell wall biosynthesis